MKKLTFLIVLCFLSMILIAQPGGIKNSYENARLKKSLFLKYQPGKHYLTGNFDVNNLSLLKSSGEEKQKLDSIIYTSYDVDAGQWKVEQKYVFEYNSNGNLIQDQVFWKDENDNWKPDTQNRHYYDDSQQIIQVSSYYIPGYNQQLKEDYREVYTYYYNGKLDETLTGSFNSSGQLEYYNKEKNYYDDEDRLIRTVYSYNYSNKWEDTNRQEYYYKSDTIQMILSYWDGTENNWIQGSISENIFNELGNLIRYNEYFKTDNQTEYYIGYYTLYDYNLKNNLSSVVEVYLDYDTNEYIEGSKEEFIYDSEQNLTDYILSTKYYGSNDWHEYLKQSFVQDNSYEKENLITPYIFSEDFSMFNHMLTGFTASGKMDNETEWVEGEKGDLFYSEFTITQNNTYADIEFDVYPNPAKDLIYVNCNPQTLKNLRIYNSYGQLLRIYPLDPNTITKEFNLTGLCQGVYIFQLSGEKGYCIKKVIVN